MIDVVIVEESASGRVIRLEGELIGSSSLGLEAQLIELGRERGLVIDLSRLDFIDSWGIGLLLRARSDLSQLGRDLRVRNLSRVVRRAVEALGLQQIIEGPDIE